VFLTRRDGQHRSRFSLALACWLRKCPTAVICVPKPQRSSPSVDEPLLSLPTLARMIGIHVRTLSNAARRGQLAVVHDTRTTFHRLRSRSTLREARRYREQDYGRRHLGPPLASALAWAAIPPDYDERIRRLRGEMHLTQAAFADSLAPRTKRSFINGSHAGDAPRPCSGSGSKPLRHGNEFVCGLEWSGDSMAHIS
jgi:hypothetical protein